VAVRQMLQQYGLEKPIWVTETGWHSNNSPEIPSSPADQSRFVVKLMAQTVAADVKVMIYWMLFDPGGYYPFDAGLVSSTSPVVTKPAMGTFRFMRNLLRQVQFERLLNNVETGKVNEMIGYVYDDSINNRTLYIAWLVPRPTTRSEEILTISAREATVYDIYGVGKLVRDGEDGRNDGKVKVKLQGRKLNGGDTVVAGEPVIIVVQK
jgi:hypothetical protein